MYTTANRILCILCVRGVAACMLWHAVLTLLNADASLLYGLFSLYFACACACACACVLASCANA